MNLVFFLSLSCCTNYWKASKLIDICKFWWLNHMTGSRTWATIGPCTDAARSAVQMEVLHLEVHCEKKKPAPFHNCGLPFEGITSPPEVSELRVWDVSSLKLNFWVLEYQDLCLCSFRIYWQDLFEALDLSCFCRCSWRMNDVSFWYWKDLGDTNRALLQPVPNTDVANRNFNFQQIKAIAINIYKPPEVSEKPSSAEKSQAWMEMTMTMTASWHLNVCIQPESLSQLKTEASEALKESWEPRNALHERLQKLNFLLQQLFPCFLFLFHCLGLAKESKLMSDLGGLSVTAVCLLHDLYEPGLEDGSEVPCMLDLVFHDLLGWYLHSYTVREAYTPLYYRIFMNRSWSQQNWAYVWKDELQ